MNNSLKNVIVVYDYAFFNGGAAKVAIQSAIALSKQSSINVYYFAAVGPVCEDLDNSNVHCVCLNIDDINSRNRFLAIKNGVWNTYAKKKFSVFLSKFNTMETVIHFHGWAKSLSASVVQCASKEGFKCIITLHDYFTICPNGGLYNYQTGRICKIKPSSLMCYVCNCDKRNYIQKLWRDIRQICQNYVIKKNRHIVYISISDLNEKITKPYVESNNFFRINNPTIVSKKEHIGRSNTILYVGRLSEEKGVELFCQCISELKKDEKIDLEGMVIGDGVLYHKLQAKYGDIIKFLGWKSADIVQKYMQNARALVLPSKWYEGAPLTIIEALMNGLPCIVSDCTSAVELIRDGINGFVFEQGNVNSLKDGIIKILDDTRYSYLTDNIKKQFNEKDFNMDKHIGKLLKVYNISLNID